MDIAERVLRGDSSIEERDPGHYVDVEAERERERNMIDCPRCGCRHGKQHCYLDEPGFS
jgi:hypothetical protein